MPFSWAAHKKKTEIHMLSRLRTLAKMPNSDFAVQHPEFAREAELGITDVEIKKYVKAKIAVKFKYGKTPKPSVIIKRMNRT